MQYKDRVEHQTRQLVAAIQAACDSLALLLSNPREYGVSQWPVANSADAEALRSAYDTLETALFDHVTKHSI